MDLARRLLETGPLGEVFVHLRLAEVSAAPTGEVSLLLGLAHLRSGDAQAAVEDLLRARAQASPEGELGREIAATLPLALQRLSAELQISNAPSPDPATEPSPAHRAMATTR
ncbi:MAG: hypothetical protein H0V09_01570, partial [Gemmatimonadetes bacterium]|nr:hypothetical protein [Gemmatimonadota bacterium]